MNNIEKIHKEIERRKKEHMYNEMPITIGRYYEDRDLLAFIDFDLQEQPEEDLEREIEKRWEELEKDYSPSALNKSYMIVSGLVGEKQFSRIARHFYNLGLNARKEEKK